MKKIVVIGDTLVGKNTFGIQRFAYEILLEIDKMPRDYEIEVLIPQCTEINKSFETIPIIRYGYIKNSFLWRQICFPWYLKKEKSIGVDFTLGLSYFGSDIICLYDCIYENMPMAFTSFKEKIRRKSYLIRAKKISKSSKFIITDSDNTKRELLQYYRVTKEKITVVYNSWQHFQRVNVDETIFDLINLDRNQTYFFSLGSGLRHKNFKWIVQAAIQNSQYTFVVAGNNELSNYIAEIKTDKVHNIIFTGYLSDEQIKALMKYARAFIHPSFYEGFGIPPLEALATGTEIIISNASCLPEVYGDSARYIQPDDYAIDMDEIMSREFNENSNVLEKYSWNISADKVKIIFDEIVLKE